MRRIDVGKMQGNVCIVTGSNSGIGRETALALAAMDATVVMAVRNRERGEKARIEIIEETGNKATDLMMCDVSSADSIRLFANEFKDKYDKLDVLINNAGAVFGKRQTTPDGFEQTFAVNYLGAFLLTCELLQVLKSSAPSRVINVSSGMHKTGKIDFNDLQSERKYKSMEVYASSKLMVTTITYKWARHLEGTGVTVNVVEPGFVATNLGRNSGSLMSSIMFGLMKPIQVNPRKGAETSVLAASSDEVEGVTGRCFAKLKETTTAETSYDRDVQTRLWDETVKLLEMDPGFIEG
jgi:NAD(P)-dependent dehydrogenase (short-subunit alcohol dehydrogenase family)